MKAEGKAEDEPMVRREDLVRPGLAERAAAEKECS
jgi:hypothetical protein